MHSTLQFNNYQHRGYCCARIFTQDACSTWQCRQLQVLHTLIRKTTLNQL